MIANKCLICGSSNIRADRALSGRLVCNSCGTPLGVRRTGKSTIKNLKIFSLNRMYIFILCIFIVAFIIVIS